MAPGAAYRDDLELGSFREEESLYEPDSPLALSAGLGGTSRKPRWLSDRTSRWRVLGQLPLRPRWTSTYVFLSIVVIYLLYCLVRRSPLLASKLPSYSGEYDVGAIDLEITLGKPRVISETVFKDTGKPAFNVETVLFTLYYPATKGATSSQPKHPWMPRPISLMAEGYARFARINNFVTRPVFTFGLWAIAGGIKIPANVDAPLHQSEPGKVESKFPVMVFSHGQASSRTDYTHYCGELASRGHVVAAIEHRDGSGPGTIIMSQDGSEKRLLSFSESELLADPPLSLPGFKEEQLAFRQAEIEETIEAIRSINEGQGLDVFHSNLRHEGRRLNDWAGRLDFEQLTIGGHSYGATGALQALKGAPSRTIPARGGIILDPGKSSGPLNHDIDVPILVIHSNSWSSKHSLFFGRPHFDTVKELVDGVLSRVGASWFMTSIGTSHPSVTDAPLIEPVLLSWTTGATVNVKDGLHQYVKVSMEFFSFLKSGDRSGILAEEITHAEYGRDDRDDERRREMPEDIAKSWQIHVAPPA